MPIPNSSLTRSCTMQTPWPLVAVLASCTGIAHTSPHVKLVGPETSTKICCIAWFHASGCMLLHPMAWCNRRSQPRRVTRPRYNKCCALVSKCLCPKALRGTHWLKEQTWPTGQHWLAPGHQNCPAAHAVLNRSVHCCVNWLHTWFSVLQQVLPHPNCCKF